MKALRFTIYLDVFATAADAQHAAASRLRQVAAYLEQVPPEAVHRPLTAGLESGGITGHPVLVDDEMDDEKKVEAFASVPPQEHWKAIWKVEERD